ncbi:MAG: nucleotidyltransferase domain-containing protein [Acidimicrobiia bacterium]
MLAGDVLQILDALQRAGLRVWLDGGWGVDALLGVQTREHEDVDVVVELDQLNDVRHAVAPLGFVLAEDHLPTRAVLRSPASTHIDLHPVTFDTNGCGWQKHAGPDGTDCPYPANGFGQGRLLGTTVPCLTPQLQVEHHRGYRPRARDLLDMAALAVAFGLALPEPY